MAQKTLPVPMSDKMSQNLSQIQAKRQLKEGKRTSLKSIAQGILENAKA